MASNAVRNFYKVYVGNIPWTVGHLELKKYFSKFGHVSIANVIFDKNTGLSRNYGFVFYTNREGFENAIKNNHKLEGQNLRVQQADGETGGN